MMADLVADFQQQAEGELGHGSGAVGGYVADHHATLLCGFTIHHVITGGQHANQLQPGALIQKLGGNGGLVHQYDIRFPDPRCGFLRISQTGIDGDVAIFGKSIPAQIPGIDGHAFENYDIQYKNLPVEKSFCIC